MKSSVKRVGRLFRILGGCLSQAWKDSDCHYHIPKSRFNDNFGKAVSEVSSKSGPKAPAKNYFLGSFRDCLLSAWRASDVDYHIPKSRFKEKEFDRTV